MATSRGEIACRIIWTLRDNRIRSVAVYSDVNTGAPHVRMADVTIHIGPSPARESYLVTDKIVDVARRRDADEIHPDYGFLSGSVDFAIICEETGTESIDLPTSAINAMDDKISVRAVAEVRDIPTAPGLPRPELSDGDLIETVPSIGFPVLIKPSAGGGGRGMHRTENAADPLTALATAHHEAAGTLGGNSLFIKYSVDTPRHIGVQILADKHGNIIHLGEREYSLQRCHQKVIEEVPSPLLGREAHSTIGEAACNAARSAGYVGAGTVEFIVPAEDPSSFLFMGMNTCLQAEHPITEQVTGLDLVALQADTASKRPLLVIQKDVTLTGHSIETRVYAEDPTAGFLPTSDTVTHVVEPSGAGIRADSGITDDSEVSSLYDPMLMKIISHGENREQALEWLDKILGDTIATGVGVNINFCHYLLNVPEIHADDLDIGLLDYVTEGSATSGTPDDIYLVAATDWLISRFKEVTDSLWLTPDGWHASTLAAQRIRLGTGEDLCLISIMDTPSSADVIAGDVVASPSVEAEDEGIDIPKLRNYKVSVHHDGEHLRTIRDGIAQHFLVETTDHAGAANHEEYVIAGAHGTWVLPRTEVVTTGAEVNTDGSGVIQAPMPDVIIVLSVEERARIKVGDALLVMGATKMEHTLTVKVTGEASSTVVPGDRVTGDQQLAIIIAAED